jgi:hypothetical protein
MVRGLRNGVGRGKVVHPFARVHRKWFTRARGWRALGELLCEVDVVVVGRRHRDNGAPGSSWRREGLGKWFRCTFELGRREIRIIGGVVEDAEGT